MRLPGLNRDPMPSIGTHTGTAEALAKLFDDFTIESVVAAQGDLARQAPFPRPPGDRVRRNAQQLRDL